MTDLAPLRVLLYTHESYGLGHLKNTLALTRHLAKHRPEMRQLIVTGAALPHPFVLPEDADYVKLPSVTKLGPERYGARCLPESWEDTWALRRDIVLATAEAVQPHVLIADNLPHGHCGELRPALRRLKEAGRTLLVAGLRDVIGDPEWVQGFWTRHGVYELLDDVYDLVLVYGQQDVHDPVSAYRLSERAAAKTRFVGYLQREPVGPPPGELRAELGIDGGPLVLVLAGGSGDEQLLEAAVGAARLDGGGGASWLLVPGPLAPAELQRRARGWAAAGSNVHMLPYVADAAAYVAAANAVVTRGGYSTACEILSLAKPAVVIPDEDENREQLIRARAFAERGLARMIPPQELSARRLLGEVAGLLDGSPRTPATPLRLDGLDGVLAELESFLTPARTPA
jgi:predicted glycosyltransferase